MKERILGSDGHVQFKDERGSLYVSMPGYPFLPCPICHGSEGCDHSVPERARTAHPGLQQTF